MSKEYIFGGLMKFLNMLVYFAFIGVIVYMNCFPVGIYLCLCDKIPISFLHLLLAPPHINFAVNFVVQMSGNF